MEILALIMQWLHLVGVIAAIGGAMALRLVAHPAAMKLDQASRAEFQRTAIAKWRKFTMHSILLIIVSGVFNLHRVTVEGVDWAGGYGAMLGVKVLLALAVFTLAIMLVIDSEALAGLQAKRPKWMLVVFITGFVIVLISAWLRLAPRKEKGIDALDVAPAAAVETLQTTQ